MNLDGWVVGCVWGVVEERGGASGILFDADFDYKCMRSCWQSSIREQLCQPPPFWETAVPEGGIPSILVATWLARPE